MSNEQDKRIYDSEGGWRTEKQPACPATAAAAGEWTYKIAAEAAKQIFDCAESPDDAAAIILGAIETALRAQQRSFGEWEEMNALIRSQQQDTRRLDCLESLATAWQPSFVNCFLYRFSNISNWKNIRREIDDYFAAMKREGKQ